MRALLGVGFLGLGLVLRSADQEEGPAKWASDTQLRAGYRVSLALGVILIGVEIASQVG